MFFSTGLMGRLVDWSLLFLLFSWWINCQSALVWRKATLLGHSGSSARQSLGQETGQEGL